MNTPQFIPDPKAAWFQGGFVLRRYRVVSSKITAPLRLVLLSDLHGTRYGRRQRYLLNAIAEAAPQAVLLAGDMLDEGTSDTPAWQLLKQLGDRYLFFAVLGNHECRRESILETQHLYRSCGITLLQGTGQTLSFSGCPVHFCGVDSPARFGEGYFGHSYYFPLNFHLWRRQLSRCAARAPKGVFSVLLSHHPEHAAYYAASGLNLTVCGHAHGGQVRIPGLVNGLYAPGQGVLPPYAGGLYSLTPHSALAVSRGLVRNLLPRPGNPPEMAVIQLTCK